jgi:hypothetical protein|uniref:Uncharacterized protein n=1 Tax=viral metagenome TaxID=1070528 RepID=A0A6C0IXP1_9ZZZZ
MVTLLTGDTLYGKYGFRPIRINRETYSPDDINIKNYKNYKKIMSKTTISEFNKIYKTNK